MKNILTAAAFAAGLCAASAASAATVVVNAMANSSTGGSGASTGVVLGLGDLFTVTVDGDDLWSAGALPRWSDANGLDGDLYATGTDESGESAGTLIGTGPPMFPNWVQDGLSAPYGSLVGKLGSTYKFLGTSFSGAAWGSGELTLFYWDSNAGDNSQFITATVTAVPEPMTWTLMIGGFGLAGMALRRRPALA